MNTLVPIADIFLSGRRLDYWGLAPFLKSVTCSRSVDRSQWTRSKPKGQARRDDATLVFDNSDNQVGMAMAMREEVEVWLGYPGHLYHRGTYSTYSPSVSFSDGGDTVSLACQDLSIRLLEESHRERRWPELVRLGDLVDKVAGSHGMQADVHASLKDIDLRNIVSVAQESDWQLLDRAVTLTGAGFMYVKPGTKERDGVHKLVVRPFGIAMDEIPEPWRNERGWPTLGYRETDVDIPVSSVSVRLDPEAGLKALGADLDAEGDLVNVDMGDGHALSVAVGEGTRSSQRTLLGTTEADQGLVPRSAGLLLPKGLVYLGQFAGSAELWKSFAVALTVQIPCAHPGLYPNTPVTIVGIQPFSGPALITRITDTFGDSGYSQSIELRSGSALDTALASAGDLGFVSLDTGEGRALTVTVSEDGAADIEAEADGAGP